MTVKITQSTFFSIEWCKILVWDQQTICPNYGFYLTKHYNTGLAREVWDSEGTYSILSFSVWQGSQPWWWWCRDAQWTLPQEVRDVGSAPVLLQLPNCWRDRPRQQHHLSLHRGFKAMQPEPQMQKITFWSRYHRFPQIASDLVRFGCLRLLEVFSPEL